MDSSDTTRSREQDEKGATPPHHESTADNKLKNIYSSDSDSDSDLEYTCDVCKKSFTGLGPLRQHKKSGKHIKAVNREKYKKEMDEDLKNLEEASGEDTSEFGYKPYTECKVCRKEFSGIEPYRQHLKSKSHKKKKMMQEMMSKIGNNELMDEEKLKVFIKRKHQSRTDTLESPGSDSDGSSSSENSEIFECKECEKVFNGVEPYYIHMISKLHRKKKKQKDLIKELTSESTSEEGNKDKSIILSDGVLNCKTCRTAFPGPESVLTHLKSKRHKEMLEFRRWKKEKKSKAKQEVETELADGKSEAENSEKPLEVETFKAKQEVETELADSKSEAENSEKPLEGGFTDSTSSAYKSEENSSKLLEDSQACMHESELLDIPKQELQNETENPLHAYESYKNYKKIINSLKSEDK